jgi:hypothetical protein
MAWWKHRFTFHAICYCISDFTSIQNRIIAQALPTHTDRPPKTTKTKNHLTRASIRVRPAAIAIVRTAYFDFIYRTFFSTDHGQGRFDGTEAYGTFHLTFGIFWHSHGLGSFVFNGVIIIQWDSNTRWMQSMRKTSRVMGFHTINNNWNTRA